MESLSKSLHKAIYRSKERETQLRRSSEFLEFAQTAGGFGIFDLDLATAQLSGTPLFFELIGLPYRAISPSRATNGWRPFIPEDFETVVRELSTAISAGGHFRVEYRTLLSTAAYAGWRRGEKCCAMPKACRPGSSAPSPTSPSASDLEDTLRHTTESLNIAQTAAGVATMDLNFAPPQLGSAPTTSTRCWASNPRPALDELGARLARVHPEDLERIRQRPLRDDARRRSRLSL